MKILSKLSMACAALMTATSVFAEPATNDSTSVSVKQSKTDTVSRYYSFGRREVIVNNNEVHFIKDRYSFEDGDNGDNYNFKFTNYVGSDKFHPHLSTIDLGASRFSSKQLSVAIDDSLSYLDLNRGFHFSIGLAETALPIVKDHLGIGIGIGLKHDCYSFSTKNLKLGKDSNGHLTHYADSSKAYAKSKLRNTYLMVPVVLEIQPMGYSGLIIQAGVEGNLRMWSKTKMKTESGEKEKNRANLNMNLFSYNLVGRIGFDGWGIFVRANMTPLFTDGKGPELYPYSAGISLCL